MFQEIDLVVLPKRFGVDAQMEAILKEGLGQVLPNGELE